jgi:DNA-binding MarR family transcriptional regulator
METVLEPVALANGLRPLLLQLNRHLRRELGPLGITGGQAALLHAIRSNPDMGVRALAEREGVTTAGMSTAVTRLERAGLVSRTRATADRRRVGLELTARGQSVLRSARSRRTAWLASRLAKLEPRELAVLESTLDPLRRLLEHA